MGGPARFASREQIASDRWERALTDRKQTQARIASPIHGSSLLPPSAGLRGRKRTQNPEPEGGNGAAELQTREEKQERLQVSRMDQHRPPALPAETSLICPSLHHPVARAASPQ